MEMGKASEFKAGDAVRFKGDSPIRNITKVRADNTVDLMWGGGYRMWSIPMHAIEHVNTDYKTKSKQHNCTKCLHVCAASIRKMLEVRGCGCDQFKNYEGCENDPEYATNKFQHVPVIGDGKGGPSGPLKEGIDGKTIQILTQKNLALTASVEDLRITATKGLQQYLDECTEVEKLQARNNVLQQTIESKDRHIKQLEANEQSKSAYWHKRALELETKNQDLFDEKLKCSDLKHEHEQCKTLLEDSTKLLKKYRKLWQDRPLPFEVEGDNLQLKTENEELKVVNDMLQRSIYDIEDVIDATKGTTK